jgi:hypothetical protein
VPPTLRGGIATAFDNPTANEFNVARSLLCSVNKDGGGAAGVAKAKGGNNKNNNKDLKRAPTSLKSAPASLGGGNGNGGGGGGGGKDKQLRPYGSTAAADLCRREMPFPPSHYVLSAADMADMEYPIPTLGGSGRGEEAEEAEGAAGAGGRGGGGGGGAEEVGAGTVSASAAAAAGEAEPLLVVPEGYVVTQPSGGGIARAPHLSMVAIDCEMCYTGAGDDKVLELTRASAVVGLCTRRMQFDTYSLQGPGFNP